MTRAAQDKKWLVIVVQARAPTLTVPLQQQQGVSQWVSKPPTKVTTISAKTAKEAAEKAGVPAGATAYVCQLGYVETFERPEKAPLVKKAAA